MKPFTAADAAQMATDALSLDGPYGRRETDRQIEMIKGAARAGLRETIMTGMQPQYVNIVRLRLESLGFSVIDSTGREPEDYCTIIRW